SHTQRQYVVSLHRPHITAYAVVLVMTSKLSLQNRPPFLCLPVIPYLPKPVVHLFAFHTEFLTAGLTPNYKLTLAAFVAIVGKAKKVKGVGSTILPFRVLSLIPAKRVYIPKNEHEKRPLGLPALEDKIVQKGIARILEAIYEADFLDCSYGFRPARNCHQAINAVDKTIMTKPIGYVIEADIKGYFD
ncbi:unnamed protein product, partial [marine sediment metagenome]